MASFNKLAMAAAVASQSYIDIRSTLFGLCRKIIYTPTQSPVRPMMQEYSPASGDQLQRLLKLPVEKWAAEMKAHGKPQPTAIGKFRLEACLSDDRQFCAVQLTCFGDTYYEPVTEPIFFQGDEAKLAAAIL